jgi:phosphoheptose isomerase
LSDAYLSNPNLKKIGINIEFTKEQVEEYIKCAKDPIYFVKNYMKIIHVDKGLIPFDLYEYQEEMINKFNDERFVITKMPRQSGKSTAVISFILHYILFNESKNVALLANKAELARELLDRLKKAYENLPLWLQQGITTWNKGSIELENGSKILATSTTGSAARGQSFSLVFLDEFAFVQHNIANDFFKSVYPTISSGQETKMIIVSTPKGMNHFYKMWVEAEEQRSNFKTLAVDWWETPGRDSDWKLQQVANTSEEDFNQEFACEFLGSTNTLVNVNILRNLAFINPTFQKNGFDQYGEINPDHQYVVTVDTARGVGLDNSAFVVVDITTIPYRVVAKFKDSLISPLLYPELIYNVATNYNEAFVLVEINDIGEQIANILANDLEYENIFVTNVKGRAGQVIGGGFGSNRQLGVRTTKQVKRIGCSTLKDLIENNKIIIEDFDIIEEMSNFINKKDSYQADEGYHDDLVMCLVLFSWLIRQPYFKDLTNSDIRERILKDKENMIEADLLPFGFKYDAVNDTENEVADPYSLHQHNPPHSTW